jgi:cytochrome c-type biogenesis protein CcmH/NrfG
MGVAKQRITRKDLKQPDQFITMSVKAMDWVRGHTRHILYGLGGIVVIAGLIAGVFVWQQQRHQQAEALLSEAIKQLDNQGDTEEKPRNEQALTAFQTLVNNYLRTPAAIKAYWYLGHLHFARGDYAAALTAYQQAQRLASTNPQLLLPTLITLNIGYAQEAHSACPQALTSFNTVLQSGALWLRGEAYLGIGRCYEHQGDRENAIATYQRALSDAAVNEATRQTLEERLALLQPKPQTLDDVTGTSSQSEKR